MSRKLDNQDKSYWRSLNELAETDEFQEFLHREFPEGASELNSDMSRRKFMSLMGASMALAGLVSCRKPVQKIIPYVNQPEQVIPGVSNKYATTMPFQNSAYGLVVESHEGRPTKIEGNELHPSSLGKSNIFTQAATLSLYDPDRSGDVRQNGAVKQYSVFVTFWRELYTQYLSNDGEGLAVISGAFSSPTMRRLQREFMRHFPEAEWVVYEPVSDENMYKGVRLATGDYHQPVYDYSQANVVLTLDADFVMLENENIINAKKFADARRVTSEDDSMNRLYAVESSYTLTGGMADHRMRVQSRQIGVFALALANALRKEGVDVPAIRGGQAGSYDFDIKWITELAKDLARNRGESLIVAGRNQPPAVHALVYALNDALGNIGSAVAYRPIDEETLPSFEGFQSLVSRMNAGEVETLCMLESNPVYNAPGDIDFTDALGKVANSIHLSSHYDETSQGSDWHIPSAHFLESWGDAESADGTFSIIQPLIAPLYNGKSIFEIANLLATGEDVDGYRITRETWADILGSANFEKKWRKVIHDGVYEGSGDNLSAPRLRTTEVTRTLNRYSPPADVTDASNLEVVFQASPSVFDGRFANNGWLQELPDPITKLSWDNAAVMSPKTAEELDLELEDLVTVEFQGNSLDLPVWIVPGFADYTVVLELGYGRTAAGRVANEVGVNTFKLRTANSMNFGAGLTVRKSGEKFTLASTQDHWSLEDRPIYREATKQEYGEHPKFVDEVHAEAPPNENLWEEHSYEEGYQWGMAIDLSVCTGCNACTIACQSENNIPIVGKEQVGNGREMHWIRMDRYFAGDVNDPEMVVQPVTCMHCENAPCETVCPVNATVHDDEGLNVQIYNRCIGTRYCSNNCPYKVRRFNFFNYTHDTPEVEQMGKNPDVTVRSRGVMEKCTYCTQRIQKKKIQAKNENRELYTDEVVSACQQTCPTDAIVFGDINDPESQVSKVKQQNRDYAMLGHLNTQPRTTYQAKIRNPNPALENHG
ncbi:MAG: TAT-variant-translocated molybdopterin oxidoreductase [Candidatus Marinimicrobia bacterium]|nr:TAT-variant-translocated molybdopterin oxidoreductase [Candidatus Neomarinimicrobiota bacterium]MCF7829931.1 TAT-variant-translocated molybdopterin oxidoreductase [Candidatus Neomarinimicrobiota bacterium]MCF7879106.1 TAT-variant-translocated molybdopterin oxidoreductase [Candidatus Neomarinimicrobiota bacterium]